jgi:hypothetical protein
MLTDGHVIYLTNGAVRVNKDDYSGSVLISIINGLVINLRKMNQN